MGTKRDANSPIESESKKASIELAPSEDNTTSTMEKGLSDMKIQLDEGIGSITTKLGEFFNAQSQTMEAIGFHGQHLATLSAELAALKIEVKEKDKVINKLTNTWRVSLNRMKRDVDENTRTERTETWLSTVYRRVQMKIV